MLTPLHAHLDALCKEIRRLHEVQRKVSCSSCANMLKPDKLAGVYIPLNQSGGDAPHSCQISEADTMFFFFFFLPHCFTETSLSSIWQCCRHVLKRIDLTWIPTTKTIPHWKDREVSF